jgi:hypothetical protein
MQLLHNNRINVGESMLVTMNSQLHPKSIRHWQAHCCHTGYTTFRSEWRCSLHPPHTCSTPDAPVLGSTQHPYNPSTHTLDFLSTRVLLKPCNGRASHMDHSTLTVIQLLCKPHTGCHCQIIKIPLRIRHAKTNTHKHLPNWQSSLHFIT